MTSKSTLEDLIKNNGLSEVDLKRVMKEEHCHAIAMELGEEWETLAAFIGISDIAVGDIKERHQEPRKRRLELLKKWKKLHGSEATYDKMASGLVQINNRELIEDLMRLVRSGIHGQKEACGIYQGQSTRKTRKRKKHCCNNGYKSMVIQCVSMFVYFMLLPILWDYMHKKLNAFESNTVHVPRPDFTCPHVWQPDSFTSTIAQWNPKFNGTDCNQSVGHDLPLLDGLFVGREDDIIEVVRKAMNANILNINGAPGFGKSTVAIHAGYWLFKNCTSVRYINIEELSLTTQSDQFWKNRDTKLNQQGTALTATSTSNPLIANKGAEPNTLESSYIMELKQWSKVINHTTILILDNADDILSGHSSHRTSFIDMIKELVHNSKFHLHIIVVSQESLLFLLEYFDRWIVKELNQTASVKLLTKIVLDFADSQSELKKLAGLVQGCPLALNVIGNLLKIHGQNIIHELKYDLQQRPMNVLDKVSDQRQRFRAIMDLVFFRLEILKCGYIASLFPGSFSREAGTAILSSMKCLEMFEKQSLLDSYFLGNHRRYKMHRLIREYLKENVNATDMILFEKRLCKYYTKFLLKYAMESELNDSDQHMLKNAESKNINLFKTVMLHNLSKNFSNEELASLAFLVSMKNIEMQELESILKLYLKSLNHMRELLNPVVCGKFISYMVNHLYRRCPYREMYGEQEIFYPCSNVLDCEIVTELLSMCSTLKICQEEEKFLQSILNCSCHHKVEAVSFYKDFLIATVTVIILSIFLVCTVSGIELCCGLCALIILFPVIMIVSNMVLGEDNSMRFCP